MIARTLIAATLLTIPHAPAAAHDWYPKSCCGGEDCEPVAKETVALTSGGWLVKNTGEVIPFATAKASPDGQYHRCRMRVSQPNSSTRCLFVPDMGY